MSLEHGKTHWMIWFVLCATDECSALNVVIAVVVDVMMDEEMMKWKEKVGRLMERVDMTGCLQRGDWSWPGETLSEGVQAGFRAGGKKHGPNIEFESWDWDCAARPASQPTNQGMVVH
jgi:hypothetical protein